MIVKQAFLAILICGISAHSLFAATLDLTIEKKGPACTKPAVRKEFRALSQEEWQKFVSSVKRLMERPTSGTATSPSIYDQLVKIDMDQRAEVQGYALNLPFHRWLLKVFETELRKADASLAVPYWDWTLDAKTPEASPLLSAAYMGGNGTGEKHCVTDGSFAQHTIYYPTQNECLSRNFNRGTTISPFADAAQLKKFHAKSRSFDLLRQFLTYAPAGAVQNGIGGQLATAGAANDPIFWLHLAFIDKNWADWQGKSAKNAKAVNGLLKNSTVANRDTPIAGSSYKIGDVLATKDLCYRYEAFSPAKTANRKGTP